MRIRTILSYKMLSVIGFCMLFIFIFILVSLIELLENTDSPRFRGRRSEFMI